MRKNQCNNNIYLKYRHYNKFYKYQYYYVKKTLLVPLMITLFENYFENLFACFLHFGFQNQI